MKKVKLNSETKQKMHTTLFWGGLVSSLLILVQQVAYLFGVTISAELMANILLPVNTLLGIFAFTGILTNPDKVESYQKVITKNKK